MMSASLSLKEIFINVINESLRAHFHLYITNKTRHEVFFNINSLVSSDGRALGCGPLGKGFNPPSGDRILFLIIDNFQLLEKEFCPRGGLNP